MKTPFGLMAALVFCAGCTDPKPVSLALPDPGSKGFQQTITPFLVAKGTEQQNCYFFSVPGNTGDDVWIDHFQLSGSTGTHHMNVFRVKTIVALNGNPGDVVENGECFKSGNWADWPLVVNSQEGDGVVDWTLPTGVGARFTAGEKLMLQVHFVNATTQTTPGQAESWVNYYYAASPPPNELGTLFATNQNIKICPGDTDIKFDAHCTFNSQGVTVIAANGHFHSRGIDFKIAPVDSMGNAQMDKTFYDSTTWAEPPMTRGLDIQLPMGTGVDWECAYSAPQDSCANPDAGTSDGCCYTFGGHVETQEHCNAFVYYYPKQAAGDITCF